MYAGRVQALLHRAELGLSGTELLPCFVDVLLCLSPGRDDEELNHECDDDQAAHGTQRTTYLRHQVLAPLVFKPLRRSVRSGAKTRFRYRRTTLIEAAPAS